MMNTIEILDNGKYILSDILRCYVCLELPIGKQVKICERGHHFCFNCHSNMDTCGVCRGNLLQSRNFAVENLVDRLGPILDPSKCKLPPPEPPCLLSQGLFKCLHQCSAKVRASLMLPHLRTHHSTHLIDNVRSNPFTGHFSFMYDIYFFSNDTFVWSVQISDMGLFSVELTFSQFDFFGCVRMLVDKTYASQFRYKLVVKIPNKESSLEFGITNCTVSNYSDDIESVRREGKGLKINGQTLLEYIKEGSVMNVFFSVWKNTKATDKKETALSVVCMSEKCLFFKSDRKIQRNRKRNMRRKRLKKTLRNVAEISRKMSEEFSNLAL